MTRRRVLLDVRVLNTRQPTGLSRYAATLYEHLLRRNRFEYLIADGAAGTLTGVRSLPFDVPLGDASSAARWLTAIARLYDVDLLFSPYLPVPAVPGISVVLTVHDLIALDHPEWFADESVRRFFDGPLRASAAAASHLITGSEVAADDIARHYGTERARITVVPHAAATSFAPGVPVDRERTRALIGADPFILSVATLEPRKNLDRLVEAFAAVRGRDPQRRLRLVLVGRLGWNCAPLLEQIAASPYRGDILHLGHVDDEALIDLYRACDAFAYVSLAEGFGLPVLEALACGVPVVTSDIPVLREVAGDAAIYCDPHDVAAIAEAVWTAVSDTALASRLRGAAVSRAATFDWDRTAAATEAVFESALARG
ncbi:MAG: glycosyltransferase family 1 protein [Vicinamibacterales bacterium]